MPIEAHFGESTPWSVGVEEELMVLDGQTLALSPRAGELIAAGEDAGHAGLFKSELFASALELNSGVCERAGEARDAIAELRRVGVELARERGLELAAAGTHPFSRPKDQEIVDEPRYAEFIDYAGISARRQGVSGLHVHVGMPSAEACFQALEATLPWLPVILAMSANSPLLAGDETGLASNRADVLAQLPRSGALPAFRSYEEWEAFVDRFVRLGIAADYTRFWWDVRPHPRFGTLEVRMPDQPTSLALTGAFTALIQALCATVLEGEPPEHDPAGRGLYQQNRWGALRFGLDAELFHPSSDRVATASELAAELIELVKPAADRLGSADLLEFDLARTEGERQRESLREGGLKAVCADLVDRTLSSAQ
ncbi:MAG: YbdK family carboxylate-amine ligase [Actinobacteria bacterium]|nr:YbdK family carboxylate-amine ligase [Actinomycetota bacterium]